MKRLFVFMTVGMLMPAVLSGCAADAEECAPAYTIHASMPDVSRTTLGDPTETGYRTTWTSGDAIGVFSDLAPTANRMFVTRQSAPTVDFTGTSNLTGSRFHAYYPYLAAAAFDGENLQLELPAEQCYGGEEHLLEYAPMAAFSRRPDELCFRNLCGLIRLQLSGTATIEEIRFEVLDGREINGRMTVRIDDDGLETSVAEGTGTIVLSGLSHTLSPRRVTSFFIALPAGDYRGIRVTIRDSEKGIMVRQATNHTLSVRRSQICSIAPFVYTPTGRLYEIGDYYEQNGVKGVVFDVDETGQHGKIVSLDEISGFFGYGEAIFSLTDRKDGRINKRAWKPVAGYAASEVMSWASAEPWYIPAIDELTVLWQNRQRVMPAVVANGGQAFCQMIGTNQETVGYYWSSTCLSAPTSWSIGMGGCDFLNDHFSSLLMSATDVSAHARKIARF